MIATDFRHTFIMTRHDADLMNAAEQRYFYDSSHGNLRLQFGYIVDNDIKDIPDDFPYLPDNDKGLYIVNQGNAVDGMFIFL